MSHPVSHILSQHRYRLATGGHYESTTVPRHTKRNPNLEHQDWKIPKKYRTFVPESRARLVKFDSNGCAIIPDGLPKDNDLSVGELHRALTETPVDTPGICGYLYILEGLNPNFVDVVGAGLSIDPGFFSRHKRTALWEGRQNGGNTSALSSHQDPRQGFLMEFAELLFFEEHPDSFSLRNPSDHRHINVSKKPKITQDLEKVGILHRKASFWSRQFGTGKWQGVLLVDPHLPDSRPKGKKRVLRGNFKTAALEEFEITPYQGGYLDFAEESYDAEIAPPRSSMMDDLWHYFQHYKTKFKARRAFAATRLVQKIAASNYMILIGYLDACVNELETDIRFTHVGKGQKDQSLAIAEQWEILQSWSHRLTEYSGMVDDILCRQSPKGRRASIGLEDCIEDFTEIKRRMDELRRRAEVLNESFVGLAGMAGMQESLEEAQNVRILTFLGVFFLPLSFTSSLFAMEERYNAESSRFWLYCAIAFPIAVALTLGIVLLIRGRRRGFWRSKV